MFAPSADGSDPEPLLRHQQPLCASLYILTRMPTVERDTQIAFPNAGADAAGLGCIPYALAMICGQDERQDGTHLPRAHQTAQAVRFGYPSRRARQLREQSFL